MKNTFIAAAAALFIGATASADGIQPGVEDAYVEPLFAVERGIELSFSGVFNEDVDITDNWDAIAKVDVFSYDLGRGLATFAVYGAGGVVAGDEYGVVGAEYEWLTDAGAFTTVWLTADLAYVMTDDFDNGEWVVTPSAMISYRTNPMMEWYAEAGYSWNASNDFAEMGGYGELGVDVYLTNVVTVTPSVVMPFDTADTDPRGKVEMRLNF